MQICARLRESARDYVKLRDITRICAILRESARYYANLRDITRICARLCELRKNVFPHPNNAEVSYTSSIAWSLRNIMHF